MQLGGHRKLMLAHRAGGAWTRQFLGVDGKATCPTCVVGGKCPLNHYEYVPMALVASGSGDMRIIYYRVKVHGHKSGIQNYKTGGCMWIGGSRTWQLRVAWPTSTGFKSADLGVSDLSWETPQVALDGAGNIHLAAPQISGKIRYVMLGK